MESIHIDLHGFSDEDITDLRAFLAAKDAVRDVYEVHAMQASGAHEVLSATLADTTLVAEILKEVAGAAVSISALVETIKSWLSNRTRTAAQHAVVTLRD